MASESPYSPPVPPSGGGHSTITHNMVEALRQTKPWARLLSVWLFLLVIFMIVSAVIMLVTGVAGMGGMGRAGIVPMVVAAVMYVIGAIVYTPAAVFLWKYASNIGSMAQNQAWGMEQALRAQKSFWKYVGILTLVGIVLGLVAIAVAVVVAVVSSAKRF